MAPKFFDTSAVERQGLRMPPCSAGQLNVPGVTPGHFLGQVLKRRVTSPLRFLGHPLCNPVAIAVRRPG